MRRKFIVFPLLVALMLVAALGTGMRCISATVTSVTDGNSFVATADFARGWGNDCHVQEGDVYNVSLLGIQTPTCYATEATDYLTGLIDGKKVCLVRDVGCRDSSGNILAYVGVNSGSSQMGCDVFVNAEMVREGYARVVSGAHAGMLHWLLELLQCQAYDGKLGMWGADACSDLPAPERCGAQPTATPGPEQTATPAPHEGTKTPEATPSHDCCKKCRIGKPCGDRCVPPSWRCEQPQECDCDAQ